jgi:hypothetical protein
MRNTNFSEQFAFPFYMAKWLIIAGIVALLAGSASAFFLVSRPPASPWG